MADEPIRLGGMALTNGVLVHGPNSWACAIRLPDGRLEVAAELKRFRASEVTNPLFRGPARLAEAISLLPTARRRLPGMKLPFERPRVLTAMIAGAAVTQIARGSKSLSPAAREIVAAIASLAPAAIALRSSELAAYHGAEHIAIGTYEHGEARDKEHERCGSHLVGPLLGSLMIGNVLASRAPRQFRLAARGLASLGSGRGRDGDLLVDGAQPGASALEGARQARARAPASAGDGRADRRSSSRSRRRPSPRASSSRMATRH